MEGATYRDAGVDLAAAADAVERLRAHAASTWRPEVLGGLGGFGGLFALSSGSTGEPVLVATTDGVGTKAAVAAVTRRYDTIGLDAVAMSTDDLAATGAEPLFFLDYLSVGRIDPVMVERIVAGVAEGCRRAGCALLGGEISEHPGLMAEGHFDLVGFAVGLAQRSRLLPAGVGTGDVIVGVASPGLRSNGYSLARKILLERVGRPLDGPAWEGADHTLADELLRPSVIYSPTLRELRARVEVHALAHVTGGGIPGNLSRVLPPGTSAVLRRGSWEEPRIFAELQREGQVSDMEMERVFNLGLGMLAVVAQGEASRAVEVLEAAGERAYLVGKVVDGDGGVLLGRD